MESLPEMDTEIRSFLESHERALRPLHLEARRAAWELSTTGTEEAARRAARAAAELRKLYADAAALAQIRRWLERDGSLDPLVRRQLVVLEHEYRANQLPPALIDELEERTQEIEHLFYTHRAQIDGVARTDNEIRKLLEQEANTPLRRAAWEASKEIGAKVATPLRELARRRNDAARMLGFPDYYTMELELQEIVPSELQRIAADVELRTAEPFARAKAAVDDALARRMGVPPESLRPWHYADPFFQELPPAGDVDLDALFAGRDVVELARMYYASIGLPVDAVLARSDLYERPGKDQHAFCTDMDREGDVRILCNVKNDARWMGTMLHELGHAVYDVGLPRDLPFLLRTPAHTLTTEAVAMYFGALVRDADWLAATLGLADATRAELAAALPASRARELLVFARWALVMIHFEREFYRAPERPDLNEVWWEMVARLQRLVPPPDIGARHDWATKIHLAVAPVYYHNYLLGELYAAQIRGTLARTGRTAGPSLGEYFREAVFRPGASVTWAELVVHSTGRPLDAADFAAATMAAVR